MKFANHKVGIALLGFLLGFLFSAAPAQGLVVNEFSNGPAGTQEYFELIVVGPPSNPNCGPIDIRGWIFDDNNGDFSCGACSGTGIASGHFRFAALPVWSAVPTGSIIVVYDPALKNPKIPADDPTDTSPADGVYILPTNHASIEGSVTPCVPGNLPSAGGACGSCSGNANYAGACYLTAVGATNAGLRNNGDAAQTRLPNGNYFHGVGYGDAPSLINGGPDNLFISGTGTGLMFAFTNASSDDFRVVANWSSATVASNAETPGLANTPNNLTWINSLKAPCILPVAYYQSLQGQAAGRSNRLTWVTGSEHNSAYFELQRATDLSQGFETIGRVEAAGYSTTLHTYQLDDDHLQQPVHRYRLVQFDADGHAQPSEVVEVHNAGNMAGTMTMWPKPADSRLTVQFLGMEVQSLHCIDLMGRVVAEFPVSASRIGEPLELDIAGLPAGKYLLLAQTSAGPRNQSFIVARQ